MQSILKTYKSIPQFVVFAILAVSLSACNSNTPETTSNKAYWKTSSTLGAAKGSTIIIIEGQTGVRWNAEVTKGMDWCAFSSIDDTSLTKTGTVASGLNVLYVYYKNNIGQEQRQAEISFQFEGEAIQKFTLTQLNESESSVVFGWVEMPVQKQNNNYQYVTHYTALDNGNSVRNFSLCFDKTKNAALWVAYPVHACYLGSAGRTDKWAFDPKIENIFQASCVNRSYGGSYDRGHQLPSADRVATKEMNNQTFYMSNMTPQLSSLNQQMWATLESRVRANNCSDTLYVVTGAYFDGNSTATTTDGAGNTVPLPTNYYKLLLRTKKGSTGKTIAQCDDDELISIGFWVEHRRYDGLDRSICTSVAEIEAKTGFSFFPQVSDAVKRQNNPVNWGL